MKKFLILFFITIVTSQVFADKNKESKVSVNMSDQLKTLKDLYKSGALSGYEYEEEKKRILNN